MTPIKKRYLVGSSVMGSARNIALNPVAEWVVGAAPKRYTRGWWAVCEQGFAREHEGNACKMGTPLANVKPFIRRSIRDG